MKKDMTSEDMSQTKEEFNIEYGEWLRGVRIEYGLTPDNVAEMADVPTEILQQIENGKSLELYYIRRLWKLYKID